LAIEEFVALMVIDCSATAVTVNMKLFEVMPLSVAVMPVEPAAIPLARPPALIAATEVLEELHVTEFVRFWVEPSLNAPIAVN
jgi:hypothetical protein